MVIKSSQFLAIVGILVISLATTIKSSNPSNVTSFNRSNFPASFIFGTSSAAYQYEGAPKEGGKGPSIWDNFTHKYPERIDDGSNGDVAQDFYHRYKWDAKIMKDMGTDAFRISISWPRILPRGNLKGGVQKEGIIFYNKLIDELIANGQTPFVTLFHWDLPQALEDEYGGFLSARSVADFQDYAEVCYKAFGDRVKHWITFNEPHEFTSGGYNYGSFAPGRCSSWLSSACQAGNSSTEPYIASHNILLAHAAAVKLYKTKYQAFQKGKIGITLDSQWFVPYSNTPNDTAAAKRAIEFVFGWYMHPLTYGHYPKSMRDIVKERLPKFTKKQSIMLKGSCDFIGVNYYTANYASNVPNPDTVNLAYNTDSHANLTVSRNGKLIGAQTGSSWLYIYPQGFHDLLVYTKRTYKNPTIYITENGVSEVNNSTLPIKEALKDPVRINYYYHHLLALHKAISEGVNVKGYFAWSLLDTFEWNEGYTVRFGSIYIDRNNGLKRYAKDSFYWFKKFLLK